MTRLRNGRRTAALGLTVCRQRRVSRQARIGRQRRRNGWVGRPQSAVPHMTVPPMSPMSVATPGESTGTPCQCQNYPRQDQLAHTHYNHPTPIFMILNAPRSSSGRCRTPRQIVRQYIYQDRRQTQHDPDPEQRRMMDASPVAWRCRGFHVMTSSARHTIQCERSRSINPAALRGRVSGEHRLPIHQGERYAVMFDPLERPPAHPRVQFLVVRREQIEPLEAEPGCLGERPQA
jgi:hypothetical protein